MIELKTSKTTELAPHPDGRRRFVLDGSIGAIQMVVAGKLQDISPRFVPDGQGWRTEGTPYLATVSQYGAKRVYPNRDEEPYVDITPQMIIPNLGVLKDARTIEFSIGGGVYLQVKIANTRIKYNVRLPDATLILPTNKFLLKYGLTFNKCTMKDWMLDIPNVGFMLPQMDDPDTIEPIQRVQRWLNAGLATYEFDVAGLRAPFNLDPPLDVSVAAGADDDYVRRVTSVWSNTYASLILGRYSFNYYGYGGSMRFLGINIPSGATVTVAYLTVVASYSLSVTVCRTHFCCVSQNNPAQMASYADHIGRPRTTPVVFDGVPAMTEGVTYTTPDMPSVVAPVQQVVTDQGGTGNALILVWEDDDNRSNIGAFRYIASYEHSSYAPPAIHLEWTTGGGGGAVGYITQIM